MRILQRILITGVLATLPGTGLLSQTLAHAVDASRPQPAIENEQLYMFLRLNSPEQIAAFYEARGFPRDAIERLRRTCFVMAHVENRGREIVWLELKNWRFIGASGEIRRLDRQHWDGVWDEINLPQASRSTFGWTQLPEVRDLQPDEPVGGNMILPATAEPFTLEADFHTGRDKRKGMIRVRFTDLRCARDTPAP
jgi:hypothetical protein